MKFTMTKIAAAAMLAAASMSAHAVSVSTGGVFNMYGYTATHFDQAGLISTQGAPINVDTVMTGFVDQSAGTWGVSSTAPFYGQIWTASNGVLVTAAGNYALDTTTGHISIAAPDATGTLDGQMHFTVGANQVAGAIDFAWGTSSGIRVVDVWDVNADGSLTAAVVPGMENGPFGGFAAAFNLTGPGLITPVPEASTYGMMLAGLGMVGFAVRRRKLMA